MELPYAAMGTALQIPSGMTNKSTGNGNGKSNSRSPSGMTKQERQQQKAMVPRREWLQTRLSRRLQPFWFLWLEEGVRVRF